MKRLRYAVSFCLLFMGIWLFPLSVSANAMPSTWAGTGGLELWVAEDCPVEVERERLTLRLDAKQGTYLEVWASCDGGPWEKLAAALARDEKEKLCISLVPRRHDTIRFRLTGTGQMILRSVSRTFAAAKGGL